MEHIACVEFGVELNFAIECERARTLLGRSRFVEMKCTRPVKEACRSSPRGRKLLTEFPAFIRKSTQ